VGRILEKSHKPETEQTIFPIQTIPLDWTKADKLILKDTHNNMINHFRNLFHPLVNSLGFILEDNFIIILFLTHPSS